MPGEGGITREDGRMVVMEEDGVYMCQTRGKNAPPVRVKEKLKKLA